MGSSARGSRRFGQGHGPSLGGWRVGCRRPRRGPRLDPIATWISLSMPTTTAVCIATLADLGYKVETDLLPLRVEVAASDERWVDVHPVRFDVHGLGIQGDAEGVHFRYPPPSCSTTGLLEGLQLRVVCRRPSRSPSMPGTSYDPKTSMIYVSSPPCARRGLSGGTRVARRRVI